MKQTKYWITGTVLKGRVTIDGVEYAPDEKVMAYDGRCNGMSYWFRRYWKGDVAKPYAYLWGSETTSKFPAGSPEYIAAYDADPAHVRCAGGGVFSPWVWWRKIKE